jgi:hypothetical protein
VAFEKYDIRWCQAIKSIEDQGYRKCKRKADAFDPRTLSHLLRSDLVAEALRQDNRRVVNKVHALLGKYDVRRDHDNIFAVEITIWLERL